MERGTPLLAREDRTIVAVASDTVFPDLDLPQLHLDDIPAVAGFILRRLGLDRGA